MEASNSKMKLKLIIDKKGEKVLFAEANKDFVDFLFSLMSLPFGTLIKLLTKNHMSTGCLGNIYHSIESLSDTCFQPTLPKDSILNPNFPLKTESPLFLTGAEYLANHKFYVCSPSYHRYFTDDPNAQCPSCRYRMAQPTSFTRKSRVATASSTAAEGGVVKVVVTYMVKDDLEVKPMSTVSSITLLNSFNILDLTSLQEKVVNIGIAEGLGLLQLSFQSKNVLTDFFLSSTKT